MDNKSSFHFGRRAWIRTGAFLIVGAAILGGVAAVKSAENQRLSRYLALSQQHAFHELADAVSELNINLEKASYATSPAMIAALCTDIYGTTAMAQMALGELPYSNVELEQTTAFITKLGDYSYAISKTAAEQGGWTDEQKAAWGELSKQADALAQGLSELETEVQNGTMTLETVEDAKQRLYSAQDYTLIQGGSMYDSSEDICGEIPTLIYDGPFSQHLENVPPVGLSGLNSVTEEDARSSAADFLGIQPEDLQTVSEINGTIPGWLMQTGGNRPVAVEVAEAGGIVTEFRQASFVEAPILSYREGVQTARDFLESRGYTSMTESYYQEEDGVLTVNFAYTQDGVICYPDLIKVDVALDTGSIVGFESTGYWNHHRTRTIVAPLVSEAEARIRLPDTVSVLDCRQAVIPTDGDYEVSCWELRCKGLNGRSVIYYLNSATGAEQQIFLLLEDESGTLAL